MIRFAYGAPVLALMIAAGCGDPYGRYAKLVYRGVDASMAATWAMSSRVQLTAVHGSIPSDSMVTVEQAVLAAARTVREHATHFDAADSPPSIVKQHLLVRAGLLALSADLDSLGTASSQCASATAADSTNFSACAMEVTKRAQRVAFAMDDLGGARARMQRTLYQYGVVLGAVRTTALRRTRGRNS